MLKEFRDFIARGNVIDLAVGVIIGAAFGKIVTTLVEGVIMPPIGLLMGQVDFSSLLYVLDQNLDPGKWPTSFADAKARAIPVIAYGQFINDIIGFLVVAASVFLLVKQVNRIKSSVDHPLPAAAPTTKDCTFCASTISDPRHALPQLHVAAVGLGTGDWTGDWDWDRHAGSKDPAYISYISTWTPSSTTRSGGRRKYAVARTALRAMSTNSFSRQTAIPGRRVTMIVSRPRK